MVDLSNRLYHKDKYLHREKYHEKSQIATASQTFSPAKIQLPRNIVEVDEFFGKNRCGTRTLFLMKGRFKSTWLVRHFEHIRAPLIAYQLRKYFLTQPSEWIFLSTLDRADHPRFAKYLVLFLAHDES
jgi:hypothetical protein